MEGRLWDAEERTRLNQKEGEENPRNANSNNNEAVNTKSKKTEGEGECMGVSQENWEESDVHRLFCLF